MSGVEGELQMILIIVFFAKEISVTRKNSKHLGNERSNEVFLRSAKSNPKKYCKRI